MEDKYANFSELVQTEREGHDFQVRLRERVGALAVIAPHGGGIEAGTSEIADAIAGEEFSFYAFEGIKVKNWGLHITSIRFDEPRGVALVAASPRAISIHGEGSARQVVFLGGRDQVMISRLRASISAGGFRVETHESYQLQGRGRANICNRTANGVGVQLELSKALRRSFFESLSKNGRSTTTQPFDEFVAAVRTAIASV
jgi:phage replication-related protein YjqB (UPF0714/DUF867 family)